MGHDLIDLALDTAHRLVRALRVLIAGARRRARVLRHLRDTWFSEPGMSDLNRTFFTFAAYNAGPGNIRKARKRAEAMGLNPDVWFGNVEIAAGRTISREPVVYVRNILKYYTSYEIYREADGG